MVPLVGECAGMSVSVASAHPNQGGLPFEHRLLLSHTSQPCFQNHNAQLRQQPGVAPDPPDVSRGTQGHYKAVGFYPSALGFSITPCVVGFRRREFVMQNQIDTTQVRRFPMSATRFIAALVGSLFIAVGAGALSGLLLGSEVWVMGQTIGSSLGWNAIPFAMCLVAGLGLCFYPVLLSIFKTGNHRRR